MQNRIIAGQRKAWDTLTGSSLQQAIHLVSAISRAHEKKENAGLCTGRRNTHAESDVMSLKWFDSKLTGVTSLEHISKETIRT